MTTLQISETNTENLLQIVLTDEKENGCSDRLKLNRINKEVYNRTGKTVAKIFEEKGW